MFNSMAVLINKILSKPADDVWVKNTVLERQFIHETEKGVISISFVRDFKKIKINDPLVDDKVKLFAGILVFPKRTLLGELNEDSEACKVYLNKLRNGKADTQKYVGGLTMLTTPFASGISSASLAIADELCNFAVDLVMSEYMNNGAEITYSYKGYTHKIINGRAILDYEEDSKLIPYLRVYAIEKGGEQHG